MPDEYSPNVPIKLTASPTAKTWSREVVSRMFEDALTESLEFEGIFKKYVSDPGAEGFASLTSFVFPLMLFSVRRFWLFGKIFSIAHFDSLSKNNSFQLASMFHMKITDDFQSERNMMKNNNFFTLLHAGHLGPHFSIYFRNVFQHDWSTP